MKRTTYCSCCGHKFESGAIGRETICPSCLQGNIKLNSSYRNGCFNIGRTVSWGWYDPETKEFYLARDTGEYIETLASWSCIDDSLNWQDNSANGYNYEVVRELLQLWHLLPQTLTYFIEAGGVIWWNQPTTK